MNLFHLLLGLVIAVAAANMALFAIHIHRATREVGKPMNKIATLLQAAKQFLCGNSFVVVRHEEKLQHLDLTTTYTAFAGTRVVSHGARGVAFSGAQILALDRADTIAMEGSKLTGEDGSITHAYPGANVRIRRGGVVHLQKGVKAYARNGCRIINEGARIYNYGDPCVLPELEPARVVGEAGAVLFAAEGSEVITEPNVVFQ